ncbi:MAG TPA: hypothetical protein VGE21_00920 [Flavobacteriales bacterium]
MDLPGNAEAARTLRIHLCQNEDDCVRANIIVRVDSISDDRRVALCSVEQCLSGVFRRERPFHELVWSAEQALAPLSALGMIPLITVRTKATDGNLHGADGPGRWPHALWQWMGHPWARKGYGNPLIADDPFGWQRAMSDAAKRVSDRSVGGTL